MTAGDFYRKLKKLNKNLKITCFDNSNHAAGLWVDVYGNYVEVCGVDKNYLPRFTMFDERGHIVKAGWERTLVILVQKGLVDRKEAEKVFQFTFSHRVTQAPRYQDPTMRQIDQIINERRARIDGRIKTGDQYVEAGDVRFTREDLLNARDAFAAKR